MNLSDESTAIKMLPVYYNAVLYEIDLVFLKLQVNTLAESSVLDNENVMQ